MLPQYVTNLKKYTAIKLDCGLQDGLIGQNRQLVESVNGRDCRVLTALAYQRSVSFHPAPRPLTSLRTRVIDHPS